MSNFIEKLDHDLEQYANLAIHVGVNIQQGQDLLISAPIEAKPFVRKLVETAYKIGAKNVYVEWNDEQLTLLRYLHAPDEALDEFPMWKAKGFEEMAEKNTAFLTIYAPNPDLLKEVDPKRVARANKVKSKAMYNYGQYIKASKVSWSIVAVPTEAWAQKIFPQLSVEEGMKALWKAIFSITRVDREDPNQAWQEHLRLLHEKVEYLNKQKFTKLHYRAEGTDLTVELPEGHRWLGGGEKNQNGVYTVPNMPTEEVFTVPKSDGVNGTVTSSKPLNYGGTLIENFRLTFKDGKVVDIYADHGQDILQDLIDTDEGAARLGEVALVPHSSPISQSNLIFFNTLYDENASSHLALGSAYPTCLEDGTKLTKEELTTKGINDSLIHVDFMIGSAEMNIDAETADGQLVPLMRNGEWAMDQN